VARLADAVAYVHERGILHRDLKPANVLMQEAMPRITDFGLAKIVGADSQSPGQALTKTGTQLGTTQYMAPEQAEGRLDDIGPHTDLYALGAILYELLTGRPPFRGQSEADTLRRIVTDEPVRIGLLRPAVPRDLETICLKCLEKQPVNRYGSMRELGDDLERFLEGRPIRARRIGWAARALKWVRRRPRATAAGALTGVLLVSLAAVLIWSSGRESAHNADMSKALQEIGLRKAVAKEQDWLARNHKYSAQIRAGAALKATGALAPLRDALFAQMPGPGQKDVRGFEWHYLWRIAQDVMLPGHNSLTTAIAYSANGNVCAVGSEDGGIDLFDRRTGKPLGTLPGLAHGPFREWAGVRCPQQGPRGSAARRHGQDMGGGVRLDRLGGCSSACRRSTMP
jgi:eukaryotic-like serine/threonine-protein kinase